MITAIIVDDEILNIKALQFDLEKYCPSIEVVGVADNIQEAVTLILKLKPDVIFLDIQIHDTTGFDLLNTLDNEDLNVIIISAYENYGLQAIKHSVIDYILKPVQTKDLIVAVRKLEKKLSLLGKTGNKSISNEYVPIANKEDIELVKSNEILFLEAKGSYTELHTSYKKIISSKLLKDYESLLNKNDFLRVHHSYIINIHSISKYLKTKNGSLLLSNNSIIPISAAKKKLVLDLLGIKS